MSKSNPFFDSKKQQHHRKSGFRNPLGSPKGYRLSTELARDGAHFLGELLRFVGKPHPFPPDHVIPEPDAIEQMNNQPDSHKVTWLGHASFLVHMNEKRLITDPFLSDYASPFPVRSVKRLVPPAIAAERLPALDVILVSHNHYDHLDAVTLRKLAKANPSVQVVVPLGLKPMLKKLGFSQVTEVDWYESVVIDSLEITGLPAVHMSRRGVGDGDGDGNRTLWCGFAMKESSKQLYFSGDTAYGEVFKEIGERVGPFDAALIPIGAYKPRSLMRNLHVSPEEGIQIGLDIQARKLIAMHWGTIRLTTEPLLEPKERFLADRRKTDKVVLRIGETCPF